MKKFNLQTVKKSTKGITLVSLVVTIIILLILASVSINMLIGENGIIKQSQNAKEKTESSSSIEQVSLAVTYSMMKNGNINYDDLKNELNTIEKISGVPETITTSSFPLIVKVGETNIEIKENGEVTALILPIEYTQVEYLKSTGTQYIDTGYKGNNDFSWEVKVKFEYVGYESLEYFGMGSADDGNNRIELGGSNVHGKFWRDYGSLINDPTEMNKDEKIHIFKYYGDGNLEIDNINQYENVTQQALNPTTNIYIFKINNRLNNCVPTYVYYNKIYQNNKIVRNMIPCYRKSDKKPGMYDLVTNVFYENAGTGEFLYGAIT